MSKKYTTDVLVAGGSIAGFAAAITAKEENPDLNVLIVEKYTAGYSGKANRGAGIVCMLGEYSPEEFMQYQTEHIGKYLNDQDALRQYAENLNANIDCIDKWSGGGKVCKNADGTVKTLKWRSQVTGEDKNGKRTFDESNNYPWTLCAVELDYLLNVRKYAVRIGIKIVDRVGIVDVVLDGGKISGAVGYNIDDGEQYIFEAKSVVLANGNQNYRIMPMWGPGRGEGLAAAWRAGAKFSNGEFCSFYNWISPDNFESNMGVEYALYNDKGENVGIQYTLGEHPDIDEGSLAEWYKQVKAGNGPMHYRAQENILMPYLTSVLASDSYFDRPFADRLWGTLFFNAFSVQKSDEILPGLISEYDPLQVDLDFATTVPGLFAAGDICYSGTRGFGAVPVSPGRIRGGGIAFAAYSGRMAGPSAAKYAAQNSQSMISDCQLKEIDERWSAPLRQKGTISVMEMVAEIQKVVQPLGNSLYRSEERMQGALARIQELKNDVPKVKADDPHSLFGVNEIVSMLLCAELFFTAALQRKESLGWFLREDYPSASGQLKWYTLVPDGQSYRMETEDVPLGNYKYQPN